MHPVWCQTSEVLPGSVVWDGYLTLRGCWCLGCFGADARVWASASCAVSARYSSPASLRGLVVAPDRWRRGLTRMPSLSSSVAGLGLMPHPD